jgi:regulator of sigma E protease
VAWQPLPKPGRSRCVTGTACGQCRGGIGNRNKAMGYLLAILALELLLTLHELGHALAARLFGMRIAEVSIGFGPGLLSFRQKRTEYVIRLIPLGAFFRIRGMNPYEPDHRSTDPESFASHSSWQRIAVVASGSLTNAIGGFLLLVALYASGTHVPVAMTIGTVEPGSEAARAQLRPGDVVERADNVKLERWSSLVHLIADSAYRPVRLTVQRNGQELQVDVRPRSDAQGSGRLGISQQYVYRQFSIRDAVVRAAVHTRGLASEGLTLVARMLRGAGSAEVLRQSTQSAARDIGGLLRGLVNLSLLMAGFFLLPLPSLDGGRLLFLLIEAARRKPVHPKVETAVHALGLLALIAAILAIPVQRIARIWTEQRRVAAEREQTSDPALAAPTSDAGEADDGADEPQR